MTHGSRASRGAPCLPELAIFGRRPEFAETLHVGRPFIGDREALMERIGGALDRLWLTNQGPLVHELETRIQDLLGVRHCVVMCNGTVGLEIATRALELSGEVIVPSFTFVATPHALQWQQITPVFCDIDPKTHTIDPGRVEELITPRTTGILAVHTWGRVCEVEALEEIARRHGLKLIFDAAHAFGCSHKGRMVGGFGQAEILSFHATKFINTFEGGAVLTNDTALAEKIGLMKNFGFVIGNFDEVRHIGMNGKMSEISAAMGLTSLDAMDEVAERNRENHLAYREQLADIPGLQLLEYDESERSNWQYTVVENNEGATGLQRDALVAVLHAENVRARRYFYPGCHRMEPYRSLFPHARLLLPETEALGRRVLVLPTGMAMDGDAIQRLCNILRTAIQHPDEVRAQLARSESAL